MKRIVMDNLREWINAEGRKPLILRGARQVGKTWLVRELAKQENRQLLEFNFERNPEYIEIFKSKDLKQILTEIEILKKTKIDLPHALLFLDEIQECPEILHNLRWFYEELPSLAVVAAGSLLEFLLEDHDFSMPVGRVSYRYVEPMSFKEFLWANGEDALVSYLENSVKTFEMTETIHTHALELFRQYFIIGGMPAVVEEWVRSRSMYQCSELQTDLMTAYRDDFNKYRKKIPAEVLRLTLDSAVKQIGGKFVYSKVNCNVKQPVIKSAADMLCGARLCRRVTYTAANGLPLGGEIKENLFKLYLLDTGLANNMLGLNPMDLNELNSVVWTEKGAFAEQMAAQLLSAGMSSKDGRLYYWQQSGSGAGEIDFLIQKDGKVCPVEVKAGTSGSMKSLHAFMESKGLDKAFRFDMNPPSQMTVDVKTTAGKNVRYELVSYPLYMAEMVCGFIKADER